MLGELITSESVSTEYDGMFKTIIKGDFCEFDKAYSIYMLGQHIGHSQMAAELEIDTTRLSKFEKLALNLVKFGEMEGRGDYSELFAMLGERDKDILFVNGVELGRIINSGNCPALLNGLGSSLSRTIDSIRLSELSRDRDKNWVVDLERLFDGLSGKFTRLSDAGKAGLNGALVKKNAVARN